MGWPLQVYAGPRAGDFDNVLCGASCHGIQARELSDTDGTQSAVALPQSQDRVDMGQSHCQSMLVLHRGS